MELDFDGSGIETVAPCLASECCLISAKKARGHGCSRSVSPQDNTYRIFFPLERNHTGLGSNKEKV